MHPAGPMPVTPPTSVRVSSALLFGVAGLALVQAVIELVFTNTGLSVYRDAYTGETGSGFVSLASATFGLLFGAGAAILAILNGHGRKNARLTTYILGGVFLVCGGFGTFNEGVHGTAQSAGDDALAQALPLVYGFSVGVADALTVLAVLAAMVLLALPPSARFFQAGEAAFHARKLAGLGHTPLPQHYPHTGYQGYQTPPPFAQTPPPFAAPVQQPLPPHTGSMPAIDPWADKG